MRPASVFAGAMGKYPCNVFINFNGNKYNAKSTLNLIAACMKCGSEIELVCDVEKILSVGMIIVTKTNTGAQALRRRICGTIFVRCA